MRHIFSILLAAIFLGNSFIGLAPVGASENQTKSPEQYSDSALNLDINNEFSSPWGIDFISNNNQIEIWAHPVELNYPVGEGQLEWVFLSQSGEAVSGSTSVILGDAANSKLTSIGNLPIGVGQLRAWIMLDGVVAESVNEVEIFSNSVEILDPNSNPEGRLVSDTKYRTTPVSSTLGKTTKIPDLVSGFTSLFVGNSMGRSVVSCCSYDADSLPSSPWQGAIGNSNSISEIGWGVTNYTYTQGSGALWSAGYDYNNSTSRTCTSSSCNYVDDMYTGVFATLSLTSFIGATDLNLTFDLNYDLETNFDYFEVQISTNGSSVGWTQLGNYTGSSSGWTTENIDLINYSGLSNVTLYFIMSSDGSGSSNYDGVFIDDISISGNVSSSTDLIAVSVSGPSSGFAGNNYSVSRSFINWGSVNSSGFNYGLYLSANNVITTSDHLLYNYNISGLNSGQVNNITITVSIPSTLSTGTYYWGLIVDRNNVINESNESNNAIASTSTFSVGNYPDLEATSISGPSSLVTGNSYSVSRSFKNSGTASVGSFSYGIYLSTNNFISTSDTLISNRSYSGLSSGSSSTQSVTVTVPSSMSTGTYYWGLLLDQHDSITESDENNNELAASSSSSVTGTGYITVEATFQYYNYYLANNSACSSSCYSAARYMKAELWDYDSVSADDLLATAYLDNSGKVKFTNINNNEIGTNQDIYIKLYAYNSAAEVSASSGSSNAKGTAYSWKTSTITNVADGFHNYYTQSIVTNGGALNIASSMLDSRSYANFYGPSSISQIDVRWPRSDGSTGAYYYWVPSSHLVLYDGFDATVNFHEYGHYVDDYYVAHTGGGGSHTLNSCTSEDLGWSEGWASYFAISVKTNYNYLDPTWYKDWYEYESGKFYWYTTNGQLNFNSAGYATINNPSNGTHWDCLEEIVTGVLWDLHDGNDDDIWSDGFGDSAGSYTGQYASDIWDATMNYTPSHDFTLADFTTSFLSKSPSLKEKYFDILVDHAIRPDFSCTSSSYGDAGGSGDAGYTISSARSVSTSNYHGCMTNSIDYDDYYSIYLPAGKALEVTLVSPASADFDFRIASSSNVTLAASYTGNGMEWANWSDTSNISQTVYVHVSQYSGSGMYGFNLDIVTAKPDLLAAIHSVYGPISGPSTAKNGDTVSLSYYVKNIGTANSGQYSVDLFIVLNNSVYTNLGTFYSQGLNVSSGSYQTVNATLPTNLSIGTTYFWVLYVDYSESVDESVEYNNGQEGSNVTIVSYPDLVADWISGPSLINPGDSVNVTRTIKNIGGSNASSFTYGIYLSVDSNITTSDLLMYSYTYSSLCANCYSNATISVSIPTTLSIADRYYWGLYVDSGFTVSESSGTNNDKAGGLTTVGCPATQDDAGSGTDAGSSSSSALYLGSNPTGSYSGCIDSNDYSDFLEIWLDSGRDIDVQLTSPSGADFDINISWYNGTIIDSSYTGNSVETVSTVATSASGNQNYIYIDIFQYGGEGEYQLKVWTNKTYSPDLVPIDMYVYDLEVNPGDSVQIWRQIKNNGKLESGAFNYSLYLSSDANITTGDYLVGNYSYMSLGSYVTTSLNITATIPSTMPAGDYYWGLIVDAENTISENSESNNALTYGYVMRILACQSQQDDMGQGYDAPDWGASSYMGISVGSGTSCLDLDDYVDVFSITAGAHSRIELILQSPSGNDFELFLVDSTTGNDVSSYQTSNGREINMVSITSLTYYIIVYNEDEIGGDYNLIVNVVSLADVSVNLITIPNTVQVSSSFNVAISIDNYGSADTGSFAVDVLLSRNHLVDASDDILYTGQYSSIISGQQGQFNQNIQLDQGYDSGPYYLCISLNSGEAMDESRYTNNWKCKGIVVETPTPTVPTFINADESIVNDPSVRFEWNPSTSDGISISYYHIFVNGVMTSNISQEWVVITLDEGTSSVEVYAVNDVGTRGQSDSVEVIVDTVLPTAPILPNSALTIGLPGVLILEVPTCSDNVGVSTMEYSIDSVWVSFDSNELIFNLSSGLTTITFRCTDLAGNLGPSSSLEVTADLTPPNAPVVDGPDGWINSQSHTYTIVSESDEGTGIAWTVYSLDGGFWTRVVNDSITISLISGNHSIEFQSYDLAGNAGDITSFSLMVDEIGPNMPSIDLEPYYDSLTQISINVSTPEDFGSGYSYFTWSLDNGEISVENGSSIELGVLDEGKHVIFVTAWDEVGNPSTTARAWFNVDGTAPLAPDVECPNDWQTTSIIICSVEYTFDRGSGIKHLEVQIDNEDWNVISIVEGSIELSLSDGIHNVSFRWIDSSNHVSEISVQSISIDTIAPIIDVIQNGVIDQYVNDANSDVIFAKLSIVASDNGSGIAEIAYSFDSGETWKHVSSVDGIESPHGMQGEQVVDFRSSDWAGNEVVETFTIQFGGNDPDLIVEESKGAFGDTNSSLLYGGSIAVATLVLVMFLVSRRSKGKEFD